MIFGIALAVVAFATIALIAYYDYKKKQNWPDHWRDKAVVYGAIRWRSAFIRASGMRVRRHGPPTSPDGIAGGAELAASERTGSNGEYELVLDKDGDGYLVVVDADNNVVHLTVDPVVLSFNSPRRLDLLIPSLAELRKPTPLVGRGVVTTHQELHVVVKVLHTDDGGQYRLVGALASESIGGRRIEAYGATSGDSTRMYLDLAEYVILPDRDSETRPFVGRVAKKSAAIVATNIGALPSYHEQYDGVFVLTFAGDDVLVDTDSEAILERLSENVGEKCVMSGDSRFRIGIIPETITPSRYGILSD